MFSITLPVYIKIYIYRIHIGVDLSLFSQLSFHMINRNNNLNYINLLEQ